MREEQIKRMVSEGKITKEEGDRLLKALEKSRSGEAEREVARKAGKTTRHRGRTAILLSITVAVLVAAGLALGLYFGLRKGETAAELFKKGEFEFSQGRYEKAIEHYRAGLEKAPRSAAGHNLLGMAYRFAFNRTDDRDLKEKEIAAFRKAIELDPDNAGYLVNLGATLFYEGKKKQAAAYLKKALEVYPGHPDRANIEEMIRQSESMIEAYTASA